MINSKIKENCISSENKCNLLVSQVDYEYNKRMSNIFETHMLYSLSFFFKGINACHFQWYQKYGPLFVFWIFHVPIVVIVDPDMAKKAIITLNLPKASRVYSKVASVFGQRVLGRGILTEIDHETWHRKRAMLNPAFHRKYLMNLMESFNSVGEEFLEELRKKADGKTSVRMADEFAKVTLDIIGKVGIP